MDYYDFCELHRTEISALLRKRCEALREPITRYVADELAVLTAGEPDTRAKMLKAYCCEPLKNYLCEPHPDRWFPLRRDFFAHNDLADSGINQIVINTRWTRSTDLSRKARKPLNPTNCPT